MFEKLDGFVSVLNDGSVHLSVCLVIHNYETVNDFLFPVGKSIRKSAHLCNDAASEINYDLLELFLCSAISDYSLVIAPVVAELCTTSVALSAPPNSYQNNSQS